MSCQFHSRSASSSKASYPRCDTSLFFSQAVTEFSSDIAAWAQRRAARCPRAFLIHIPRPVFHFQALMFPRLRIVLTPSLSISSSDAYPTIAAISSLLFLCAKHRNFATQCTRSLYSNSYPRPVRPAGPDLFPTTRRPCLSSALIPLLSLHYRTWGLRAEFVVVFPYCLLCAVQWTRICHIVSVALATIQRFKIEWTECLYTLCERHWRLDIAVRYVLDLDGVCLRVRGGPGRCCRRRAVRCCQGPRI